MRDYIILNGVNSNTITGLLISKLPPITKPKQRTTVEEIDGRDGDIITKLGYSAYDKEFTIGLYGNFDINEVIEYFNSEGTVVFSNENDKYYNYQILEQIDFEKLIRFKTAKVKMHVQPFKYPTEETPVIISASALEKGSNTTTVNNTGNIYSKPTIDIEGSGTVDIYLNNNQMFSVDLSNSNECVIDTTNLEAYNPSNSALMNRQVTGDYSNFKLNTGENAVKVNGNVTKVTITDYTRWL